MQPVLRFNIFDGKWIEKSFNQVFKIVMGQSPKSDTYNKIGDGVTLINGPTEFGYINPSPIQWTTKPTKLSAIGDILLCVRGSSIGRMNFSDQIYCIGRGVAAIRARSEIMQSQYATYLLERQIDFVLEKSTGSTFPNISGQELNQAVVYIPKRKEQQKIAEFLILIDRRIELQKEKVEAWKNYKKGVMQGLFSQKLYIKNEKYKKLTEWKDKKISQLLYIPSKIKEERPERNKLLTVRLHLKGVQNNKSIDTLKIGATGYYKRSAGQFIYGKQNLFNGAFGIIPDYLDGYLSSADIPVLGFYREVINPYFFLYYLSQRDVYRRLENISTGTGSKRIHEKELLKQEIKLPGLKEQEKIVRILSVINKKIDKENNKLALLQEQKKGLMQRMFI